MILRTDSAGNLLWRKKHGNPLYDEAYEFVKELPNGDFICAGLSMRLHNNVETPDIGLTRLDASGNIIWHKNYSYYSSGVHQYVNDLILTSDGGFAMTGFITNTPFPQRNDVFILKTDGNGIITGINNGFQMVDRTLNIYPNPNSGQFSVSLKESSTGILSVKNAIGQTIEQKEFNKLLNSLAKEGMLSKIDDYNFAISSLEK